jgi:hypothetical protein
MVLSAVALSAPALAQPGKEGPSPVGPAGPVDTEKVKLIYAYGDDPCPQEAADEIQVCVKMPEQDRYRIPKEFRGDPYAPQNASWAQRAKSLETVGLNGVNSCSTVGPNGFTGCFAKLAREAKEERKTLLGNVTWRDALAKAREKRLGNLDAESEAVEAKAKVEEANTPAEEKAAAEARARLEQQDKGAGTK